ncbi:hypothetical protein [Beijerinckia indica]|uniref:Uncharacterized protein n=1 Tax=Beijerinckia indica subsp. indica (strain ATCC 9039 / DSM 1715 / NCIMB 8712) TaxID=395963 RepID=B2IHE4_BEII9|nr:hypothetical protein [Beijerinckia indica]ACB95929.1 hypothetical protein Bind_2316 [Beijerinckia indica subsp. indica ATCC 9039]
MPYYLYEVPVLKYSEERNWPTEAEALSAIKHVARRCVADGAAKDQKLILKEKSSGEILYEGALSEASKPLPPKAS